MHHEHRNALGQYRPAQMPTDDEASADNPRARREAMMATVEAAYAKSSGYDTSEPGTATAPAGKARRDPCEDDALIRGMAAEIEQRHRVEAERTSKEATSKFMEASDALYGGDPERAAALFNEAANAAATRAPNPEDVLRKATAAVKDKRMRDTAVSNLFEEFPEIQTKKAYAIIADEYADAFMAAGDSFETAIRKAGEAIGEEYGLGKWKAPIKRPSDAYREEESAAAAIAEIAASRPGWLAPL